MVSCYGSDLTPYDWTIELAHSQPVTHFDYEQGTLMKYIANNSDYSYFFYLIKKGSVASLLNSLSVNYTLFIPDNNAIKNTFGLYTENIIKNIDKYTAKEIVLYHILPMFAPLNVLQSSKLMYLETKINKSIYAKILCQTNSLDFGKVTILNNRAKVIKQVGDTPFTNGLLLEIDNLLIPPAFETTFKHYISC